jgi:prepilin-type processing-associated H-X9-DG protein
MFSPSYGYNADGAMNLGLGGLYDTLNIIPGMYPQHIPTKEADVVSPSQMIALGDGFTAYKRAYNSDGQNYSMDGGLLLESEVLGRGQSIEGDLLSESIRPHEARRRHQGLLNMIYCDGHVEGGKIQRWFFTKTIEDIRQWNADNQPHPEVWDLLP